MKLVFSKIEDAPLIADKAGDVHRLVPDFTMIFKAMQMGKRELFFYFNSLKVYLSRQIQ